MAVPVGMLLPNVRVGVRVSVSVEVGDRVMTRVYITVGVGDAKKVPDPSIILVAEGITGYG